MRLILFMTRGVTLSIWEQNGSLMRELSLYEALSRQGVEVAIVTWGGRKDLAIAERFPWLKAHVNLFGLPMELYERLIPLLHAGPIRRCSLIKSNQANGAHIALRAARLWNKPFIARCGYMWSSNVALQHPDDALSIRKFESDIFQHANICMVTTQTMRQYLEDCFGISPERIRVVPNYVPRYMFTSTPEPANQGIPIVCQVGRLHPEKNLIALVEACAGLPVILRLIGEGDERQILATRAKELGTRLELLGMVRHEDLPRVLSESAICTLVSHYEGHPKALIEYMAVGRPIVATDVPGIAGLAQHEKNALLCNRDAFSIRQALVRLLEDFPLREQLAVQARQDADVFSLETVIKHEMAAYKHVLAFVGGR